MNSTDEGKVKRALEKLWSIRRDLPADEREEWRRGFLSLVARDQGAELAELYGFLLDEIIESETGGGKFTAKPAALESV